MYLRIEQKEIPLHKDKVVITGYIIVFIHDGQRRTMAAPPSNLLTKGGSYFFVNVILIKTFSDSLSSTFTCDNYPIRYPILTQTLARENHRSWTVELMHSEKLGPSGEPEPTSSITGAVLEVHARLPV